MQISNKGINLIANFEGFSSCPYWDSYGSVWTRGYGEAGGRISGNSPCITRQQGQVNLFRTPAGPPPPPPNPLNVFYPAERRVVNSYLSYMKHPNWHKHGLLVCYNRMVEFRKNIYDAAVYGGLRSGRRVQKGWDINHRYNRYEILKKYTY